MPVLYHKCQQNLINQKEIITYSMVREILNIPLTKIYYYTRVHAKIDEIRTAQIARMEEDYIATLANLLKSNSINVNPYVCNIAKLLGLTKERLVLFPSLKTTIKEVCKQLRKQRISNIHKPSVLDLEGHISEESYKFLPQIIPINGKNGKKYLRKKH